MAKYRVEGADRDSGEDVELVVEAEDESTARAKAGRRGLLVSSCTEIGTTIATTQTMTAAQRPSHGQGPKVIAVAACAVLVVGAAVWWATAEHKTGPSQTAPSPAPIIQTATVDPKTSFESVASLFMTKLRADVAIDNTTKIGEPSIDVRKTDSLVSPYVGILQVRISTSSGLGFIYDCTLKFGMVNDKWVLQSAMGRETISIDPNHVETIDLLTEQGNIAAGSVQRAKTASGL